MWILDNPEEIKKLIKETYGQYAYDMIYEPGVNTVLVHVHEVDIDEIFREYDLKSFMATSPTLRNPNFQTFSQFLTSKLDAQKKTQEKKG